MTYILEALEDRLIDECDIFVGSNLFFYHRRQAEEHIRTLQEELARLRGR